MWRNGLLSRNLLKESQRSLSKSLSDACCSKASLFLCTSWDNTPNTMSAERPFVTWTFDRHCETMDWSPAPAASLSAVSAATAVDGSAVGDADLVIVGVFAPPAKDDDDGDKERDVEEEKLRQEAIKKAEEERRVKHKKMEEEREHLRQNIRDKVRLDDWRFSGLISRE